MYVYLAEPIKWIRIEQQKVFSSHRFFEISERSLVGNGRNGIHLSSLEAYKKQLQPSDQKSVQFTQIFRDIREKLGW